MYAKAKVLASIATFGIILGMALMGMALKGYKSNNNVVYSSKYHVVWKPKYRRSALLGPIAKRRKAGVLSHTLRREFRPLESRLPTLWTNRYLVSTVGRAALVGHKTKWRNQKNVYISPISQPQAAGMLAEAICTMVRYKNGTRHRHAGGIFANPAGRTPSRG